MVQQKILGDTGFFPTNSLKISKLFQQYLFFLSLD